MLKKVGVDTDTFKAHLVRGASTSAAVEKGVHIPDVLRTADWSKESKVLLLTSGENLCPGGA